MGNSRLTLVVWTAVVFVIGGVTCLVVPSYPKNNVKHTAFGLPTRFAYTTIASSPSLMQMSSPTSSDISAEIPSEEQTEEQSSTNALFDVSEFTDEENENVQSTDVFFEDVESDYDDVLLLSSPNMEISDHENNYNNNVALTDEEDRILTDREDRLFQYINNTQKVESCILIGVEDLSIARKAKKNNELEESYTLEESMVEMRELIKTSGLVLQGEITQRLQEVNPRTYIGTGKVTEAQALLDEINSKLEKSGESCCTVVFVSLEFSLFSCNRCQELTLIQSFLLFTGCRTTPRTAKGIRKCI